ncbi:DUF2515 family protein [Agrobacterium vaccinii]|uniref:DUF2515 family protein n=1 Tax=Agrobacterium vaccinii TaxID=2735528 RepID=UPI001E2AE3D9|nr:hypothetical protein [Agrobacterium vaccinii]UHS59994.1 hypothetical protein HRS00_24050 [Agrobacterium vaccinii]
MVSGNNAQPSASDIKNAEAGAEKGAAPGNVSETCETCIAADCKKKIEEIEKEKKRIGDIEDVRERNKAITSAYKSAFDQDPSNHWLKLGSIVSSQVGCAMDNAKYWPSMHNALGKGNKAIFEDIYPATAYRARHGYEDLKKCYAATGKELKPRLREALDALERGDSRGSADIIGDYEQKKIINDVYKEYSKTFRIGESVGSSELYKWWEGHKAHEIPVSYECGGSDVVNFPGSISDAEDRVDYYNLLMDKLESKEGW